MSSTDSNLLGVQITSLILIYGLHKDGDEPEIVARRCGVDRGRLRRERTDCVGDLLGDSPIAPMPVMLVPCPILSLSTIPLIEELFRPDGRNDSSESSSSPILSESLCAPCTIWSKLLTSFDVTLSFNFSLGLKQRSLSLLMRHLKLYFLRLLKSTIYM